MKKLTYIICFISIIIFSPSCKKNTTTISDFSDFKSSEWRAHIGDTIEVTGYLKLNEDGTGVLLADKDDYGINGLIAEVSYIALGSENIRSLNADDYLLAKVKIKGRIRATTYDSRIFLSRLIDDLSQFELEVLAAPTIVTPSPGLTTNTIDFCIKHPTVCNTIVPIIPEKYALLYSGGINPDKAYSRYWNDMVLYYSMLIYIYGYNPENIIVVYKDGVPKNNFMPVHYAASPTGINDAFAELKSRMNANDQFFFFMTNHGGQVADAGSTTTGDEESVQDVTDECTFYYNFGTKPYDDDIAILVNSLPFSRMICVMEQCFSGGMIYDLRGNNRIIMTAASQTEVSYGGSTYDDFVMLLASALIGIHQESGADVDADADNNGKVSLTEAFRWAVNADTKNEHPKYEDSGDGKPNSFPSDIGAVPDGAKGKSIYEL